MYRICKKIAFWAAAVFVLAGACHYREQRLQEVLSRQVLRFHVIANSDAKADQDLKLKVRDRIGGYLKEKISNVKDLSECEREVGRCLAGIERCAGEVIAREGYDYPVKAVIGDADFPKKTYGSYTFPEGTYRALNVVIGDGGGENWWCVMYPNLCFAGSVYEVIDEHAKEELRAVLTEDEYQEILAEGNLKVKFKYLDALLDLFD